MASTKLRQKKNRNNSRAALLLLAFFFEEETGCGVTNSCCALQPTWMRNAQTRTLDTNSGKAQARI